MGTIQQTIKRIIPLPLWRAMSSFRYGFQRSAQWPSATFHHWRRESIRQLLRLKDIHRGERCFIIGNGPSLKKTDLSRLKNEITLGMNRIYMLFPELGFNTSYLVSVNSLVIEQCAEDFRNLPVTKFISWRSRNLIGIQDGHSPQESEIIFLHTTYTGPRFAQDSSYRLWEGATVTYVTLQLAFHMGFDQVILIGVDHSFATKGKPNTTITSSGDDPNHFHPAYFGKGFRWQLPDLDTSEKAYVMANNAYQKAGREVLDATIGGKLTIFPKVDYLSLF